MRIKSLFSLFPPPVRVLGKRFSRTSDGHSCGGLSEEDWGMRMRTEKEKNFYCSYIVRIGGEEKWGNRVCICCITSGSQQRGSTLQLLRDRRRKSPNLTSDDAPMQMEEHLYAGLAS